MRAGIFSLSPLAIAIGLATSSSVMAQGAQAQTFVQQDAEAQSVQNSPIEGITASSEKEAKANSDSQNYPRIEMVEVVGKATSGLDVAFDQSYLNVTQPRDLEDVFRADPNVTTGGAVGSSQKIYVRNVGEEALSISIDGAEQASGVFHHAGRVSIEPELLKRVDVEAGAGSATAGPGALGGSVRFTTKDPSDLLQEDENVGALVKASGGTNGNNGKGSVSVFGMNESGTFGGLVSYVYSDNNEDMKDGAGDDIEGTDTKQELGYAKLVSNVGDHSFMLSHEMLEEKGAIAYRPEWKNSVLSKTENTRNTTTFNYGFNPDSNAADLVTTIYLTKNENDRIYPGETEPVEGDVKSAGITLQNTSIAGNHELIYGLNYREDESFLSYFYMGTYEFEDKGSVAGIYFQDIWAVTESLTLSFGARFDEYNFEGDDNSDLDSSGVSPNISANYAITDTLAISAAYAQAIRGVEVYDAYNIEGTTYDKDIDLETADNAELAVDYQSGGFSAGIGVFMSTIKDAIWYRDAAGNFAPWNSIIDNYDEDIETTGYYLNVGYASGNGFINAKFLSADTEVGGETATRYKYGSKANSIGDTIVLDGRYSILQGLQLGVIVEHVMAINNIEQMLEEPGVVYDLTVDKPDYTVVDLYLNWTPDSAQDLTVSLIVNNIFDEEYLSHASIEDYSGNAGWEDVNGSPSPGQDARLSVAYNF